MKISKPKQELARIISENGGWRDGAEWATQRKSDVTVSFYSGCAPYRDEDFWCGDHMDGTEIKILNLMPNWHQTILSREEYFHLYQAPDADGWIEWNGGECPVGADVMVVCKVRAGKEFRNGKKINASILRWRHTGGMADIISYRLHKPEQAKPEFCESVMRSIPEPETKPPIEQLAADYRNAKDCADRKQQEADDAKADVGVRLKALELAGAALGLLVSPITEKQEPELVITDLRDLRVGDEVEASYRDIERVTGNVIKLDIVDKNQPICVSDGIKFVWATDWKFIRRP